MTEKNPWRGQIKSSKSDVWLERQKKKCGTWPEGGLEDKALFHLLEKLPIFYKDSPQKFKATVNVLSAQNSNPLWKKEVQKRANMVAFSRKKHGLYGDNLLFVPHKNTWRARYRDDQWVMDKDMDFYEFVKKSRPGRKRLLKSVVCLPGLKSFDLPACHLGFGPWANAFHAAKRFLNSNHPVISKARKEGISWHLAIRRIKVLLLQGAYDYASQTIIIDPRHPETLIHELAHMVLGHCRGTDYQRAEAEVDELIRSIKNYKKNLNSK